MVAALVVVLANRGVLEPEVVPPSWRCRPWRRPATQRSSSSRRGRSASTPPTTTLVPIALVVLVAAAVPLNVAGWGPREGAAAWAFAAAGLGAAAGASVAVAYGVLALLATLPGAVLLAVRRSGPAARDRCETLAEVVTQRG